MEMKDVAMDNEKRLALVEEYDGWFKRKPHKWERVESNELARHYVIQVLGRQPMNVIDIGCGNGHTIEYLSKHWQFTQFVGLDLSEVGIEIANKRNLDRAEFITGFADLFSMEGEGCFEVALLLGVAEHFDSPGTVLEHTRKTILDPVGLLYIECPNCIGYPESEKVEGFRRLAKGSRQVEWHLFRETWEEIITGAGYEIVESIKGPRMENEFIWVVRPSDGAFPVERRCRECGCTDLNACVDILGRPCYWTDEDLCSNCGPRLVSDD